MSGTSVGFGAVTDAAGAPPRAGVIGDNAYDRLRETDRAKYSRVSAGPNGGSEWRLREIVERESAGTGGKPADAPKPADPAAATAELQRRRPHMLRHACGYALANRGHYTRTIEGWLGHRSIISTAVYTALAPNRFTDFWRE
jgi:integrase